MNTGKRIPATLTAILAILALTACGETPKGCGQGTVNNPDPGYVRWYELTADTSFCLGNAIKYLWRYHSKGRPVEDLEKARWYLCRVIDYDEKIAWTRQQHAILDTLANDPAIPDAEARTWAKLRQGFPDSALVCLDGLIEHERNQQ